MRMLIFITLTCQLMFAQGVFNDPSHPESNLQQNGQLVSVRVEPGTSLKIFVVGREEAKLDLSTLKLSVKRLSPNPGEINVDRNDGYFLALSPQQPTEIEVKTTVKNKTETFRFKLKNKLH